MTDDTYEGWANKPTWCANMYLAGKYDGEGTYKDTLAIVDMWARQAESDAIFSLRDAREFAVEGALQDRFENCVTVEHAGIVCDLLSYACAIIDWREIARHWLANWAERQEA